MTDIETVLATIAKRLTDDVYVVIDGTMLSGQISLSKLANISPHIKILYYDSCSKYLQLGLDIAMAGLVIVPIELQSIFDRLRRNTGTILYDASANIFPIYDRFVHQMRMGRFSRNAQLVGNLIESDNELSGKVIPYFPLLSSHQDYEVARKCESVGGLITFSFVDPYLNQRDSLNSFIEIALTVAKKHRVSLTKGVSFGFSIPRISAAMAENSPPFLRLSAGDRSYTETVLLAEALIIAFKTYINNSKRLLE
jgi:cystathionine beta-lyase/cystathionine gamma-synthase